MKIVTALSANQESERGMDRAVPMRLSRAWLAMSMRWPGYPLETK